MSRRALNAVLALVLAISIARYAACQGPHTLRELADLWRVFIPGG